MKNKPVKIILLTAVMSLVLNACKKENTPAKEALLSRAIYNGTVISKFYYTEKNQLSKWEYFSEEPGNNSMLFYYTLEYDDNNKLQKISTFEMPGDVPRSRVFLEYDNTAKVIAHTYYDLQGPNPAEPAYTGSFVYNDQDQLTSFTKRDMDGELSIYVAFSYYPNGFVKERNDYDETVTNQLRLIGKTIYSIPNTDEAKGWEKLRTIPLDGDEMTRTIRYERILPAHPDEINNWEYEYIEL